MSTLKSLNPTTGELISEIKVTTHAEIDQMVKQAHAALPRWRSLTVRERADYILRGYQNILAHRKNMEQLIHDEMGKTLNEAEKEVSYYCGGIENLIAEVDEALQANTYNDGTTETTIFYEPFGVCASITPWNFPLGMPHTLMMPSLLSGNTVLFKPSEEVPLIGIKYAELLNQALPKDVLQVVIGAGEEGKHLVESDVQLITFTGSQATGKHILNSASKELKRVLLELGGKDPLLVLEDADIEAAAKFGANNSFRNAGQVCVSTEKIFVHETVYDQFMELFISEVKKVSIGSMINKRQKDHVIKQVQEAIKMGAQIAYGEVNTDESNLFTPVVLTDVTSDMNIMIDETFGPVACIAKVSSSEEAIKEANRGNYALGASIFSKNRESAMKLAPLLKSGMVGINRGPGGGKGSPWVGAAQSGYGFHGSKEGHRQFAQLRVISVPL
ncbi:aldehyde dehydrogenase family protein [Bdellovibrionales bacterium]|nr:aldehyde dehydrogenase family protein [Bdellovibrionales bacterium]